ncbi:hypothetical protein LPJ53_002202 [Coemansia erecta]|uniref:RRM domain-containing protein n=1 Tax=Coemansia erecta TaxID=147472 RepID=A0A9W8CU29_9FUNG|nr:hypothetical protein LPJ53_002202 [Coemansia erecta]
MVSYADLSAIKQPDAPVAVDLNDPLPDSASPANTRPLEPADEWHRNWNKLHTKVLYFSGVTEDALSELQKLFKASRGIRLNVDPHTSEQITGNVEFRNVYDTEKAMVILNNRVLQSNTGTLRMTPLEGNVEIEPPVLGGYISIKHIPEEATESTLYDFLRPSGPMYACSFPTLPSGQRKKIAHACFTDQTYALIALEQLNSAEYLGSSIQIHLSKPPRRRSRPSAADNGERSRQNSVKVSSRPSGGAIPQPESEPQSASQTPPPPPLSASSRQSSGIASHSRSATSPVTPSEAAGGPGNGLGGVIVPGKLFVTNLHPTVSHKELFALFKKYGYIQSARVSIDPASKKSRGHGIVQFSDPNAAIEALRECQGADIKGRKITMYQYEHVNKHPHSIPQPSSATSVVVDAESSLAQNTVPFPRSVSVASNPSPPVAVAVPDSGPEPVSANAAAPAAAISDPLIDPIMLRNLSEGSRNEILTQKLISEIAANPAVDVRDASRIVSSFIKRPLEDVLALLSDPRLLASEWDLEQKAAAHMPTYSPPPPVLESHASQKAESPLVVPTKSFEGIHLRDYDTETEEFIELLLSKPESERKKKLGSKLFPLIKGMGYRDSTKITVWILDQMSHDVRSLAYILNDSAKLYAVVEEAQAAISAPK